MSRQVIAVDIDDVVVPFAGPVLEYVTRVTGHEVTGVELFDPNTEGYTSSGVAYKDFTKCVREYQHGDEPINIPPVDGVLEALNELSRAYDIRFVTSRDPELRLMTERWFDAWMKDLLFQPVITFVGNPYVSSSHTTKLQFCIDVAAVWLIEDQLKYIDQLKGSDAQGILFGDYEWNQAPDGEHFVRARDWSDVLQVIKGES